MASVRPWAHQPRGLGLPAKGIVAGGREGDACAFVAVVPERRVPEGRFPGWPRLFLGVGRGLSLFVLGKGGGGVVDIATEPEHPLPKIQPQRT